MTKHVASDTALIPITPRGFVPGDRERFAALSKEEQKEWLLTKGVPFDERISLWKVPTTHLATELPVRVPLMSTMNDHTMGGMGRVMAWFNNAAVSWKGQNFMTFRCECYPFWTHGRLAITKMTEDWDVIPDTWKWMPLPGMRGMAESQDARFFEFRGRLYMPFNCGLRQRMSILTDEGDVDRHYEFTSGNITFQDREKNWSFFTHDDQIYCLYLPSPHVVAKVDGSKVTMLSSVPNMGEYMFGTPRGGASPVLHNGVFYHFFHSSTCSKTGVMSGIWDKPRRYHIGLSLFKATPPFEPVTHLKLPILSGWPEENPGEAKPPMRVSDHSAVFPGSAMRNGNGWLIAYGINDCQCGFAHVPDELIEPHLA
jgi:hypothetical protein